MSLEKLERIEGLINSGKFQEALALTDQIKDLPTKYWKQAIIYERNGEYELSLKKSKELEKISKDNIFLIRSYISQCYAYWRLNRSEEWGKILTKGRTILESNPNMEHYNEFVGEFYYLSGIRFNWLGENLNALDHFIKSLEYRKLDGDLIPISHSLNAIAIVYELLGKLNLSLEYQLEALELKRRLGNKQDIYRSLSNLGILYERLGEYTPALNIYLEGLSIANEVGVTNEALVFIRSLANLQRKRGIYAESKKYLEELKTLELDLYGDLSIHTLSSFIKFHSVQKQIEEASEYITILDNVYSDNELKFHQIVVKRLVKSYYYLHHPRLLYKLRVQDLLHEFLEEIDTINSEQQLEIYVYLAKSLIVELQYYDGREIVEELLVISDKLETIALQNHLILEQLETMEFKAKVYSIQGKIEDSRNLLLDASELAREKGFANRAKRLIEQSHLILVNRKSSKSEKIEKLELDHLLSRLATEALVDEPMIKDEEPILITLLNEGGSSLYDYMFEHQNQLSHGNLMGSFISAIQKFGDEIFSIDSNQFNRIEHSGYSIITTRVRSLLVVYVYKGNSYHATTKFGRFIQDISKIDYIQSLETSHRKISGKQKSTLDNIIEYNFSEYLK